MPIRLYKGFFISVEAIECPSDELSLTPIIRITREEKGEALTSLYSPSAFSTDKHAEVFGFEMAEQWIDERLGLGSTLEKREVSKLSRYSLRSYECPNPKCAKTGTYVRDRIDTEKRTTYKCFYCHRQVSETSLESDLLRSLNKLTGDKRA